MPTERDRARPARTETKLAEAADLARIPVWALTKAALRVAPASLALRAATLRGTLDAWRCRQRLEALETLDPQPDRAELRRIARRHLQFRRRAEVVRAWPDLRQGDVRQAVQVEGLHHLDAALAAGRGAILVSAHFGYPRLIKPLLASHGRAALLVGPGAAAGTRGRRGLAGPATPASLTRLGRLARTRLLRLPEPYRNLRPWLADPSMRVDLPGQLNLRPHIAALAANEALIILADGEAAHSQVCSEVAGVPVPFAPGAVGLARATGATLLPTFVVDGGGTWRAGRLRLVIEPPVTVHATADAAADVGAAIGRLASALEAKVRAHPHLWYEKGTEWEPARLALAAGLARYGTRGRGRVGRSFHRVLHAGARLTEPADLYRVPLWLAMKVAYAVAPPPLLFRCARVAGTVDSLVSPRRRVVRAALERHLGSTTTPRERRRIARRYLQFRRRGAFARFWPQVQRFSGASAVEVVGEEHLDAALARGRGALLVSAHFGYARLIKPVLRSRGRPVLLVGPAPGGRGPQEFPPFFSPLGSWVHSSLLRLPRASSRDPRWNATVGVDLSTELNLRPHLAALRRNEALIVLTDGRGAQALQELEVLGIAVRLAPGAVSLARSTGAPLLPTFLVDDPELRNPIGLRLVICPPLELQVTGDPSADLAVNLRRYAAVYERHVRRYPHNWHWAWVRDGAFSNPN